MNSSAHNGHKATVSIRLGRHTIHGRLTLLYSGLFLIFGALLLAVTYGLVWRATTGCGGACVVTPPTPTVATPSRPGPTLGPLSGPHPPAATQVGQLLAQRAASQHDEDMRQFLVQSGIALAVATLLSIGIGWLVAGRVTRPLRKINQAVRTISATNLHQRLALTGPNDELQELGETFDGLLARLDAAFRAQRQFVANASHELRTPLTRQRTLIQVALSDPTATAESLRATHERVLAAADQQQRLIEALLTLARGTSGLDRREPMALDAIAEFVLLARAPEAEEHALTIRTDLHDAPTLGDPGLAERLITNLMDNAVRHNALGGYIHVRTESTPTHAVLSVRNTGPIIPAEELTRLFGPFQRAGTTRSRSDEGLGLGLSIVDAIATAHDAKIEATPRPNGGLDITVRFPLHNTTGTNPPDY
jgi:signal transduction histidine kinase